MLRILGDTVRNLVALTTRRPRIVHPCSWRWRMVTGENHGEMHLVSGSTFEARTSQIRGWNVPWLGPSARDLTRPTQINLYYV
jgi:hypothetical protein